MQVNIHRNGKLASHRLFASLLFSAVSGFAFTSLALAENVGGYKPSNVMFIFDSSGSMKRSAGVEPRIDAAKRAFSDTLMAMPSEVRAGLIAFGHRRRA